MIRRKEKLEGRMDEMLELVKELVSSSTPKKVLVGEESRQPPTKNVNAISLCKIEKDEGEKHEQIVDKNMVDYNNDVNKPVKTSDETLRKATNESVGEERKMAELPEPQADMSALVDQGSDVNVIPLSIYNRLTNEKLVETDVRLALASNSHIYPLGIAKDVLVKEEKIMFYHMNELEFEAWKSKYSKSKALTPKDESSSGTSENHRGVT
nr:hypothetical protein [Tanacetum cinerariifolium]